MHQVRARGGEAGDALLALCLVHVVTKTGPTGGGGIGHLIPRRRHLLLLCSAAVDGRAVADARPTKEGGDGCCCTLSLSLSDPTSSDRGGLPRGFHGNAEMRVSAGWPLPDDDDDDDGSFAFPAARHPDLRFVALVRSREEKRHPPRRSHPSPGPGQIDPQRNGPPPPPPPRLQFRRLGCVRNSPFRRR